MADTSASPPRLRTVAACLLLVGTVFAAGCVQSAGSPTGRASDEPTTTAAPDGGDAMAAPLAGLTAADDPAAFAETHGLDYEDGRVAVVVTLADGAALPAGHGAEVDLSHDGTVQATVPVAELGPLAAHDNVTFVRTPREPST